MQAHVTRKRAGFSASFRREAAILLLSVSMGCHMEGRSARAQRLLSELAPLSLGEPLSHAEAAVPGLRVRHPSDRWSESVVIDSGGVALAGVTVSPPPADGDEGAPSAYVQSVQFVLSAPQASRLRLRAEKLFGAPHQVTCAGRSIAETDSVVLWPRDVRGGVLIAYPARRLEGERSIARLIIYGTGWDPTRAMSGFGVMSCPD